MFKVLFVSTGLLILATLTACSNKLSPINATYLSNSKVIYAVESAVQADSIRVKDLRGNTICFRDNVELTPPQTSVNFGFCTINITQPYIIETRIGKSIYKDRIHGRE